MQKQKRETYINALFVAIHTLSGLYSGLIEPEAIAESDCVKKSSYQAKHGEVKTYLQINPNKGMKNNGMVMAYSELIKKLEEIFWNMGADSHDFAITRADLSINSATPGDFEMYSKLNRLLLCCLSDAYGLENAYDTCDFWTQKRLSIAVKSRSLEAENYDKEQESGGAVPTTNRLELRSIRMNEKNTDLQKEFAENWVKRLEKATQNYKNVKERYNLNLSRLYLEDQKKPQKERVYLSLNAFLLQYQHCIFCTAQMVDLLRKIGVENPESKAKNFKNRHSIEYFSQKDLLIVTAAIKKKIKNYFKQ